MPTYEHQCQACNYEWEDLFKISDPVPNKCPKCNKKGKVKRLISWCRGTVELSSAEASAKLDEDVRKMQKEAYTNENVLANIIGEDKYHKNELDRTKK